MVPATQVQKRVVALATASVLLCVGLLAQWHASDAAHAREHSGRVVHAQALADHHEVSANAHVHGREVHGHTGECTLLAMAHQPLVYAAAFVVVAPAAATHEVGHAAIAAVDVAIAGYRIAPKTSPPPAA